MTFLARRAEPADYDTFTRLFPELGAPDPVPERAQWDADMRPDILILEHEGAAVGYSWAKAFGAAAHVYHVVVAKASRGRGAGRVLMAAIAEQLRDAGATGWALNVRRDNVSATRLYERFGLRTTYRSTAVELPWDRVLALPREATAAKAQLVEPFEDAALEATFSVMAGRLADYRERGRVLLALAEAEEPVGLASFDPTFPGASPFKVARPGLAAALLEAMRPYARPGDTIVRLFVEDDEPLADAFRAAGARVRLETFHMEGDLPLPR
jgi:ribosomal protein S18 acetylase RimI-like enzyme